MSPYPLPRSDRPHTAMSGFPGRSAPPPGNSITPSTAPKTGATKRAERRDGGRSSRSGFDQPEHGPRPTIRDRPGPHHQADQPLRRPAENHRHLQHAHAPRPRQTRSRTPPQPPSPTPPDATSTLTHCPTRGGDRASMVAISPAAGTAGITSARPRLGAIPRESAGTIAAVPPCGGNAAKAAVWHAPARQNLRLLLVVRRNLSGALIRQPAARNNRQQRQPRHQQKPNLQCPCPRPTLIISASVSSSDVAVTAPSRPSTCESRIKFKFVESF